MAINMNKLLDGAQKMAANAKNGTLKLNGHLFTFEFCQKTWVYNVYKNGFYYINFNTKSIMQARKWLKEYENS
jgi:hypothetical protein